MAPHEFVRIGLIYMQMKVSMILKKLQHAYLEYAEIYNDFL